MEFYEKLQELRRQKGLTQEELAQQLFVSRTAVSRWESGRGYPNIESLKAMAKLFSVTVDELLSGEELLSAAEEDQRQREGQVRHLVFGLLDISAALLLFLPFFGREAGDGVESVSLLALTGAAPYLRVIYLAFVAASVLLGLLLLALQNCRCRVWEKQKGTLSLCLNAAGILLFILGRQPYAAALLFVFFLVKVSMQQKSK